MVEKMTSEATSATEAADMQLRAGYLKYLAKMHPLHMADLVRRLDAGEITAPGIDDYIASPLASFNSIDAGHALLMMAEDGAESVATVRDDAAGTIRVTSEVAQILRRLTTDMAAYHAYAQATQEQQVLVQLLVTFGGAATLEQLRLITRFASDADLAPHDRTALLDSTPVPATGEDLEAILLEAAANGLVWCDNSGAPGTEPKWTVVPYVRDMTRALAWTSMSVPELVDVADRQFLVVAMAKNGLLDEAFVDPHLHWLLDQAYLVEVLEEFYSSPNRIRSVFGQAPVAVMRLFHHALKEGFGLWDVLDTNDRVESQPAMFNWCAEHLLLFPRRSQTSANVLVRTENEEGYFLPYDGFGTAVPGPVAATAATWIRLPRQHQREIYPSVVAPHKLQRIAEAAVNFASEYMMRGVKPGTPVLLDFEDERTVDFAAAIGADTDDATYIVSLLIYAGLLDAETGELTSDAQLYWFTANPGTRWAWLVAGMLRGPDDYVMEKHWGIDAPVLRYLIRVISARVYSSLVGLGTECARVAAEQQKQEGNDPDSAMYHQCCVDHFLDWYTKPVRDLQYLEKFNSLDFYLKMAEVLGVFYFGHGGPLTAKLKLALDDIWGEDFPAERPIDVPVDSLISRISLAVHELFDSKPQIGVTRAIDPLADRYSENIGRLMITTQGAVPDSLAEDLNYLGERVECRDRSSWVIIHRKLQEALLEYDNDVDLLLEDFDFGKDNELLKPALRVELQRAYDATTLEQQLQLSHKPGPDEPEQLTLF